MNTVIVTFKYKNTKPKTIPLNVQSDPEDINTKTYQSLVYDVLKRLPIGLKWTDIKILDWKRYDSEENKVYVVVTTVNDGEQDNFADVVLITRSETKAKKAVKALKSGRGLKNLDVEKSNLAESEDAAYFTRIIDGSF